MGGKSAKTKGHSYEREIAKRFRAIYPNAARQLEYQENQCRGVDLRDTGILAIQCKRGKAYAPITKIKEVKPREGEVPLLVTKGDRERDVVCLYLDDFLAILQDMGVVFQ